MDKGQIQFLVQVECCKPELWPLSRFPVPRGVGVQWRLALRLKNLAFGGRQGTPGPRSKLGFAACVEPSSQHALVAFMPGLDARGGVAGMVGQVSRWHVECNTFQTRGGGGCWVGFDSTTIRSTPNQERVEPLLDFWALPTRQNIRYKKQLLEKAKAITRDSIVCFVCFVCFFLHTNLNPRLLPKPQAFCPLQPACPQSLACPSISTLKFILCWLQPCIPLDSELFQSA